MLAVSRVVVEGIIYRYRCGIAWRDVPAVFGPWQTIWTCHRRMAGNGTWDTVLQRLLSTADAAGEIDWAVSVDSTISAASRGRCLGAAAPASHSAVWATVAPSRRRAILN
jgi:putative transposase